MKWWFYKQKMSYEVSVGVTVLYGPSVGATHPMEFSAHLDLFRWSLAFGRTYPK